MRARGLPGAASGLSMATGRTAPRGGGDSGAQGEGEGSSEWRGRGAARRAGGAAAGGGSAARSMAGGSLLALMALASATRAVTSALQIGHVLRVRMGRGEGGEAMRLGVSSAEGGRTGQRAGDARVPGRWSVRQSFCRGNALAPGPVVTSQPPAVLPAGRCRPTAQRRRLPSVVVSYRPPAPDRPTSRHLPHGPPGTSECLCTHTGRTFEPPQSLGGGRCHGSGQGGPLLRKSRRKPPDVRCQGDERKGRPATAGGWSTGGGWRPRVRCCWSSTDKNGRQPPVFGG